MKSGPGALPGMLMYLGMLMYNVVVKTVYCYTPEDDLQKHYQWYSTFMLQHTTILQEIFNAAKLLKKH